MTDDELINSFNPVENDARTLGRRSALLGAMETNPDEYAKAKKLSRSTGVPPDLVKYDMPAVEKDEKLASYMKLFSESPTVATKFEDEDFAKLAIDDGEKLGAIESALRVLGNFSTNTLAGFRSLNQGLWGTTAMIADVVGEKVLRQNGPLGNPVSRFAFGVAEHEGQRAQQLREFNQKQDTMSSIERAVYAGAESLGSNLATLPWAFGTAPVQTANQARTFWGLIKPMLPMMAGTTGKEYTKAKSKGLDTGAAAAYATTQGITEVSTEMIPVFKFLEDIGAGTGFLKMLGKQIIAENIGEQVATLAQDFTEWRFLQPNKTFDDYINERPSAALDTFIATMVTVAGQSSIVHTGNQLVERKARAEQAKAQHEKLLKVMEAAKDSKLRERDPQTFAQFVDAAAEASGADIQDVYVDARTLVEVLNQAGLDEARVNDLLPSMKEQLADALRTGGDVRFSVGELLATMPGSEIEQTLIPHVRLSADGLSLAEADVYLQSEAKLIKEKADQALAEAQGDEPFRASSDAVYQNILGQLTQANRFTGDVNEAYAKLVQSFYTTMASRMGVTPEEVFAKHGLNIAAELPVRGDKLAQSGFERGENLTDAERLVEERFYDSILQDEQGLVDRYVSEHGTLVDADAAKTLSPEYVSDPRLAAAVHEPSSYMAKAIYRRLLSQAPNQKVILTAGGGGSGKSETLARFADGMQPDVVYDSTLSSFSSAKARIEEALAAGASVRILYTNREVGLAFQGALGRARVVPLVNIARAHVNAAKTIKQVAKEYAGDDRVQLVVMNNNGGLSDIGIGSIDDVPNYEYNEVVRRLYEQAQQAVEDGTLPRERLGAVLRGVDREGREGVRGSEPEGGAGGAGEGQRSQGASQEVPQEVLNQGPVKSWITLQPATGIPKNPLSQNVALEGISGAQGRLTRALSRDQGIGGPDNERTVLTKGDTTFVLGKITPQDWWDRVQRNLTPEEIKQSREWYGSLHDLMAEIFGKQNAERYSLAWLLSQQNTSPSGGMLNVLRAADMVRGMPKVKTAGLGERKLVQSLRGEIPEGGYDAKLLDFIDSEMQRPVRAVMGDDPRGGGPAVIDVWANRDVGKVDATLHRWLVAAFGQEAVASVQIDGDGIGETDYEYGSKFYNDAVAWLNENDIDGGNWKPYEAQAVGWVAMQKQLGASPEFPTDIVDKNTRRVSFGLAPGGGTEFAGAGEISVTAATRIIDAAAQMAGVKIRDSQTGKGSYLGDFESAIQVDVLGSPEAFQDFAAIAGYALRQTEVIIARPKKSGDVQGITIAQAGGGELSDPTQAEAFMARVRARLPEGSTIADGYQMVSVNGKPALRLYHGTWDDAAGRVRWKGKWKAKEFAAFEAAVEESANEQGIGVEFDVSQYDVTSEFNDWNANPDGAGYRNSLAERGRDVLVGRLGEAELQLLPNDVRQAPVGRAFGEGYAQEPVRSDGGGEADGGTSVAGETRGGLPGAVSVRGVHYSDKQRVRLDSSRYGAGMRGAESARVANATDARLRDRVYFYVDAGQGITPETGVGYHAHAADLSNLYDGQADPLGLSKGKSANEFETAVLDAGFDGYVVGFGKQKAAVLLGPRAVDVEYVGMGAISPGQLNQGGKSNRGAYSPSTMTISLLQKADLSTFLHETGHHFLEVMSKLAQGEGATPDIQADFNRLLDWFGIQDVAVWNSMDLQLRTPFHEKFAESFEQYLFEGKAPAPELQGVMNRFRSWLTSVYQSIQEFLKRYNTGLTDEVRQVMGRMLATEEQIRAAEAGREMVPLFKDAKEAGMSEDEWIAYQMAAQEATEAAMDQLQKRSMADMRFTSRARSATLKRLQAEVAEKRAQVRAEVEAEVKQRQVYQVLGFVTRGELAEGNRTATQRRLFESLAGMKSKLDLAALRELYGDGPAAKWRYLPTGRWGAVASADGAPPAVVAELFGYGSVDHMVTDMLAAPKLDDTVDAETDVRMLERYGDLSNPDVLARAADEAIHNEVRTRFVATELRALARGLQLREDTGRKTKDGRRITQDRMTRGAKEAMEAAISRRKLRDIRPSDLMAAETRSARAAEEALKSGDTEAAIVHKRNQLLHIHGARFALKAVDEVAKAVDYLKKFSREGTRKSIDIDYLDQIDAMLERFDLRTGQSLKAIDKRTALKDWIESQEALGLEPVIDDKLRDEAYRTHFRNMTLEEFRGLVDAVRNIEHLGRLKKKLLTLKDGREFNAVVDDIVSSIESNATGTVPQKIEETKMDRAMRAIGSFFSMHRKVASLARQMDGFTEGTFWNVFVRSMNEAATNEASMRERATIALTDLFRPLLAGERMSAKAYIPEINMSLSREARLSVALNWGNEQNRQRVRDGFAWTDAQVGAVLDRLSESDWQFVQGVWDYLDTYWPMVSEKERRVSGVTPERVAPAQVDTKFGALRGGYYPIRYNPRLSDIAESHDTAQVAKDMLRGAYVRSTTRRGHTQARVDEIMGRPIALDFGTLTGHLNQVIHDLSWHEWLIDANRIVRDKRVAGAIREYHGDNVLSEFKKLLPDIAAGEVAAANVWEAAINHLRVGATITGLAWNLSTALMQPLGFTQSTVRLGPKWMMKGMMRTLGTPKHMVKVAEEIDAKSEMMRLRGKTMQREINEIRNKIDNRFSVAEASFFYLISKFQRAVDIPTWMGAYEKQIAAGSSEETAVAIADQTVLDTQAGGQIKDLARIQRGSPLMKLWTNFYSFFSTTYNMAAERTKQTNFKSPVEVALLAVDYMMLTIIPATIGGLIRHLLKGDDDDELVSNIIAENMSYLFGLVVGLRELTFGVQKAAGVNQFNTSYGGPAGLRFLQALDKLGEQAGQGEMDEAFWKSLNNVGGIVFHYPAGQINKTVGGAVALIEGETENPGVLLVGP